MSENTREEELPQIFTDIRKLPPQPRIDALGDLCHTLGASCRALGNLGKIGSIASCLPQDRPHAGKGYEQAQDGKPNVQGDQ